jgi:hypothetical protein
MGTPQPHIWQGTLAYLRSQEDGRDEAGEEVAHQEKETTAVLEGCGRLTEAESE